MSAERSEHPLPIPHIFVCYVILSFSSFFPPLFLVSSRLDHGLFARNLGTGRGGTGEGEGGTLKMAGKYLGCSPAGESPSLTETSASAWISEDDVMFC